LLAGLVIAGLAITGRLDGLEYWSLAQLFEWRGARNPILPIVIVSIDESTFSELNEQWPFARTRHAALLLRIAEGRPRAIVMDLLFDTPSSRGPVDDEVFAEAVTSASNVVLAAYHAIDVQPHYRRDDLNVPIPIIRRGAAAVGFVNVSPERDGQIRRVPLKERLPDGGAWPTLDAATHQYLTKAGMRTAPLPDTDSVLINFRGGPGSYPWVSYHRVVRGEIPPEYWKDKIVLIGPTSEILHDQFSTAFAHRGDMPGVEIHANALETLIVGDWIREVPMAISVALAMVLAIAGSAVALYVPGIASPVAAAMLLFAILLTTFAAFGVAGLWVHVAPVTLSLSLGYVGRCIDPANF
jgi:CHASE2 domain-containing sensor protein